MSGPPGDNILVTGALGQIGTDLVEALRKKHRNSRVIASDIRQADGNSSSEDGPFMVVDVLDTEAVLGICVEEQVGTIYHLAALLSATGEQNPDLCR